jgi:hypothetical protein
MLIFSNGEELFEEQLKSKLCRLTQLCLCPRRRATGDWHTGKTGSSTGAFVEPPSAFFL